MKKRISYSLGVFIAICIGISTPNKANAQNATMAKKINISSGVGIGGSGKIELIGVVINNGTLLFPQKLTVRIVDNKGLIHIFNHVPKRNGDGGNTVYSNGQIRVEISPGKVGGHYAGCCSVVTFKG